MTATQVNGIPVVATEPAPSPLNGHANHSRPMIYKQIVRLLLEDGSERFGCVHCEFTGDGVANVYPHLKVHKDKSSANGNGGGGRARSGTFWDPELLALTLGDLIERGRRADAVFESIEALSADRDHWKQRARDAERRLKVLRQALGGD